ncbi:hypothetical protein A2U01_0068776, partial [Trifolium medium]|nr:hypothetical protein [Trifolium medium]
MRLCDLSENKLSTVAEMSYLGWEVGGEVPSILIGGSGGLTLTE